MKLIDEIEAAKRGDFYLQEMAAALCGTPWWHRIRSALLAGQALADAVRSDDGPMREARMQQALQHFFKETE